MAGAGEPQVKRDGKLISLPQLILAESKELSRLPGPGGHRSRQHHPNLLVEIEQRHSPVPVQETIDYIRSQGYDGYFLDASGSRRPLGQFDVSRDQEAWLGHDQKAWLKNMNLKIILVILYL